MISVKYVLCTFLGATSWGVVHRLGTSARKETLIADHRQKALPKRLQFPMETCLRPRSDIIIRAIVTYWSRGVVSVNAETEDGPSQYLAGCTTHVGSSNRARLIWVAILNCRTVCQSRKWCHLSHYRENKSYLTIHVMPEACPLGWHRHWQLTWDQMQRLVSPSVSNGITNSVVHGILLVGAACQGTL